MISPTIRETRTEAYFLWHLFWTVQTDPDASWVFVLDTLNVHGSGAFVRWIAQFEGIDESTLGKKGKSGVLKPMAFRQAFLT